jgi:adenylylsulfate kinase-like enzyme
VKRRKMGKYKRNHRKKTYKFIAKIKKQINHEMREVLLGVLAPYAEDWDSFKNERQNR